MSELGESLIKGMEETLAFVKGEQNGAVTHIPEEINVRRIRKKLNMTQKVFADYFGVSARTGKSNSDVSTSSYLSKTLKSKLGETFGRATGLKLLN